MTSALRSLVTLAIGRTTVVFFASTISFVSAKRTIALSERRRGASLFSRSGGEVAGSAAAARAATSEINARDHKRTWIALEVRYERVSGAATRGAHASARACLDR